MPFRDLREFLNEVENLGELEHVLGADWNLEIGALTEILASSQTCPMILFDDIKGYETGFRIVTNVLHTPSRMALILGLDHKKSNMDMLRGYREKIKKTELIPPEEVNNAPVRKNVLSGEDVDVLKFPAPKWHEKDGGRYIGTGCIVVVKDPDSGVTNLGVYRLQVHDRKTLGIMISPGKHAKTIIEKYWERGTSCPVAVSLGHDPALLVAANTHVPWGIPEYDYAGYIRNEPVKVSKGLVTDIQVPAFSEIILEGEIPSLSEDSLVEGPFGEALGYYSVVPRPQPVIRVKSIMYRDNPIIFGAPPMKPERGLTHYGLPIDAAEIWDVLDKSGIMDVKGVWTYGDYITAISISQRYAGHPKQAALSALGTTAGHGYLRRIVIVVDEDIDPSNINQVLWAVCTRSDLAEIEIIRNCLGSGIDPMVTEDRRVSGDVISNRLMIVACKPYSRRATFPSAVMVSADLRKTLMEKWSRVLGLN